MGISNFPLTFQNNLCHIIWTWKVPQKLCHFLRFEMVLIMKKKSINQKIYIK
jgi:hypothetical protein